MGKVQPLRLMRFKLRPIGPFWSMMYCALIRRGTRRYNSGAIEKFGASVRRERIAKGITQEKLAELVDLNIRSMQKI
jgi:hypothetical protein